MSLDRRVGEVLDIAPVERDSDDSLTVADRDHWPRLSASRGTSDRQAEDVAGLDLDDIDWRRGRLTIVGKGNRAERLTLPADVGAAIAAFPRRRRPATAERCSVFGHAPYVRKVGLLRG